jgi:flagellar hook-associated protein 3 FlgL
MMTNTLLRDLGQLKTRVTASQAQLSSGARITRPSDDPLGTTRAMGLRSQLEGTNQHNRNVEEATAWQDVTDSALAGLNDVTLTARNLIVQGANDALSAEGRNAIADQLDQLANAAKEHASTSYGGRYVLSGTATQTKPYAAGDDTYHGDAGVIAREIGPGVSVQVNVHASDVLGDGSDSLLLGTLRNAAANLRGNSPAQIDTLRHANLSAFDGVVDAISSVRSRVGATTNRLEAAATSLALVGETATKLLTDVEDADMAKTIIQLTSERTAYEAALKSGASIIQPSLLDFLR